MVLSFLFAIPSLPSPYSLPVVPLGSQSSSQKRSSPTLLSDTAESKPCGEQVLRGPCHWGCRSNSHLRGGSGPWLKIKFGLKYYLDFHKEKVEKNSRTGLHSLPLSHT